MFHTLCWRGDLGAAAADVTVPALTDEVFMDRNSGYFLTEPWAIAAIAALGATITRVRSNVPKLNAINRHHIFPINQSATVPTNPNIQDLRKEPLGMPMNESMLWQGSNGAAGAEQCTVMAEVIPQEWSMDLPEHLQRLTVRATAAAAGIANTWGVFAPLVFPDQDLRGGIYSIIGCQCFDAGSVAYRFIFPRQKDANGRKLRPGGLCLEAIGNVPGAMFSTGLGEWGRFYTVEPPQIQILANATAASVQELRIDLLYLGEDVSLLSDTK